MIVLQNCDFTSLIVVVIGHLDAMWNVYFCMDALNVSPYNLFDPKKTPLTIVVV